MEELYEYNGKQYTLSQLQEKYGDKTNEAIAKFGMTKVEQEPTYTYKGKSYTRSQLEKKYGDQTDEAIAKFGFQSNVKKKEDSQVSASTSPAQSSVSVAPGGSSVSPSANKPVVDTTATATAPSQNNTQVAPEKPKQSAQEKERPAVEIDAVLKLRHPELYKRKEELEKAISTASFAVDTSKEQEELQRVYNQINAIGRGKGIQSSYSRDKKAIAELNKQEDAITERALKITGGDYQRAKEILDNDGTIQEIRQKRESYSKTLEDSAVVIDELTKDTGGTTGAGQFFKTIGKLVTANESANEKLTLDDRTADELMMLYEKLSPREKDQIWKGHASLDQKEQLITQAKINAVGKLRTEIEERKDVILNSDIEKEEKVAQLKELEKERDEFFGTIGLDVANEILEHSFQKTKDKEAFNRMANTDKWYGKTMDILSTAANGFTQTFLKGALWSGDLMSSFGDMFTDQDKYSSYDAFSDTLGRLTGFDFAPVSDDTRARIVTEEGEWNITPYSAFKTLGEMAPFTGYLIAEARRGNISGLERTAGRLLNPTKSAKASEELKLVDAAFRATYSDNLVEAREMGLHGFKANAFALPASFAEGLAERIMPDTKYLKSEPGKMILRNFAGNLKSAANKKAIGKATLDFFQQIGLELVEEETVAASRDIVKMSLLLGQEHSEFLDLNQQKELVAGTVILSGALGALGFRGKFKGNKEAIYKDISNNIDGISEYLRNELNLDMYSEEEKAILQDALDFAGDVHEAVKIAPKNVTASQIELLIEKKKVLEEMERVDESFRDDYRQRLNEIDFEIQHEGQKLREKTKDITSRYFVADEYLIRDGRITERGREIVPDKGESAQDAIENDLGVWRAELKERYSDRNNVDGAKRVKTEAYEDSDGNIYYIDEFDNGNKRLVTLDKYGEVVEGNPNVVDKESLEKHLGEKVKESVDYTKTEAEIDDIINERLKNVRDVFEKQREESGEEQARIEENEDVESKNEEDVDTEAEDEANDIGTETEAESKQEIKEDTSKPKTETKEEASDTTPETTETTEDTNNDADIESVVGKPSQEVDAFDKTLNKEREKLKELEDKHGKNSAKAKAQRSLVKALEANAPSEVTFENGKVTVKGKASKNHKERRKVILEALDKGVFDNAEGAPYAEVTSPDEAYSHVADESNSPIEVAQTLKLAKKDREGRFGKQNSEELSTPYQWVLDYFVNGGKITSNVLQELFGGGRNTKITGELRAKLGLLNKDAPNTLNDVAHSIWESIDGYSRGISDHDIKNALSDVLLNFNTTKEMREALYGEDGISQEEIALEARFTEITGLPASKQNIDAFAKRGDVIGKNETKSTSEAETETGADDFSDVPFQKGKNQAKPISKKAFDALVEKLNKAFGGRVKIVSEEAFKERAKKITGRRVDLKDGKGSVYGAVLRDGTMYLNPEKMNANTPIHEHTHLFNQVVQKTNPKLWGKIIEAVKKTKEWQDVKRDPNYAHLKTDSQIADEVFSRMVGNLGEGTWESIANKPIYQKILDLIKEYFGQVQEALGFDRYKGMEAADFAKATLNELLSGKEIKGVETIGENVKAQQARDRQALGAQYQFLNKSDFNADGTVKQSVMEAIAKEEADIISKAKADGTYHKAPNGEQSNLTEKQWVQVRTERFKDWFGDWINDPKNSSKVIDSNGEPMVVYHGTNEEFNVFEDFSKRDKMFKEFFFATKENEYFPRKRDTRIVEVFLNIRNIASAEEYKNIQETTKQDKDYRFGNPWYLSPEYAQKNGFDGVKRGSEYIAFSPNQIKSATDNVGMFSETTGDIRFQKDVGKQEKTPIFNKLSKENQQHVDVSYGSAEAFENNVKNVVNEVRESQLKLDFDGQGKPKWEKQYKLDFGDGVRHGDSDGRDAGRSKGRVLQGRHQTDEGRSKPDNRVIRTVWGELRERTVLEGFKESGYVDIVGTKVETPQDIADLFLIHRSPLIEKGHVVYLKDGKILKTSAETLGLTSGTTIDRRGMSPEIAKQLGADKVVFIHNHPSGNHKPSPQDVEITKRFSRMFGSNIEFEHVVIDTDKFTLINRDGTHRALNYKNKPKPLFSKRIDISGEDAWQKLMEVATSVSKGGAPNAIIYLAHNLHISGYDIIDGSENLSELVKKNGPSQGATRFALISDGSVPAIEAFVKEGARGFLTHIQIKGESSYQDVKSQGYFQDGSALNVSELWENGAKYEAKTQAEKTKGENLLTLIDSWKGELDQFGKETLGMNIPVVVAKAALNAMEVAVKAGMTISQAFNVAIDQIKETDWYKNLSAEKKAKVNDKTFKKVVEQAVKQIAEAGKKVEQMRENLTKLQEKHKEQVKKLEEAQRESEKKIKEEEKKLRDALKDAQNDAKKLKEESKKKIDKEKAKLQALKDKINQTKDAVKDVVSDMKDYLSQNKIEGKITSAEVNKLIKYASEIATAKDPLKAFDKFIKAFNKVELNASRRGASKATKEMSRKEITDSVDRMLASGMIEADILDTFTNKKERDIAEDHLERKKPVDSKKVYEQWKKDSEAYDKELENKKPLKERVKKRFRQFKKAITTGQPVAEEITEKSGLRRSRNLLRNFHGAKGRAKQMFDKAYNQIWGVESGKGGHWAMGRKRRKILNNIIFLRRIIEIDNNRASKGLEPLMHSNKLNAAKAEAILREIEAEIGTKEFDDLVKRSDIYFETFRQLLKDQFEAGLISEAIYNEIADLNYSPRVLISLLTDYNGDTTERGARRRKEAHGGRSDKKIMDMANNAVKKLDEGSFKFFAKEAEWLLSSALNTGYRNIAQNKLNNRLFKEIVGSRERFDKLQEKIDNGEKIKGEDKAFYEAYKETAGKVIDNPIVEFKDGRPVYKYKNAPVSNAHNFVELFRWENGVKKSFFMEESLAGEWYANREGFIAPKIKRVISWITGSALIKYLATGNNPTFFLGNTPRDSFYTYNFSERFSSIGPVGWAQFAAETAKATGDIIRYNKGKDGTLLEKLFEYGLSMEFLSTQGRIESNLFLKLIPVQVRDSFQFMWKNVTLQQMQTANELMFRVAVAQLSVKDSMTRLGIKNLDAVTDSQAEALGYENAQDLIDDIYETATSEARGILDFSRGGYLAKDLEAFVPYTNVAVQSVDKLAERMRKDPLKTSSRIAQTMASAAILPLSVSLLLIATRDRDDDDEQDKEKSPVDLFFETLDGLSVYERTNYMHIPLGRRDENGNLMSIRIAKEHVLSAPLVFGEFFAQNLIRKFNGIEEESMSDLNARMSFALRNNYSSIVEPKDILENMPSIRSYIITSTGYDPFREQYLPGTPGAVYHRKPTLRGEGLSNPNVEDFWKTIGEDWRISPIRTKYAVESMITAPSTNLLIGVGYSGMDLIWSADKDMDEIRANLNKNMKKAAFGRVLISSSDYNRSVTQRKKDEEMLDDTRFEIEKRNIKENELIKKVIKGEVDGEKFMNEAQKLRPYNPLKIVDKLKDRVENQHLTDAMVDLRNSSTLEERADLIISWYGDLTEKRNEEVIAELMSVGGIITSDFWRVYMERLSKSDSN